MPRLRNEVGTKKMKTLVLATLLVAAIGCGKSEKAADTKSAAPVDAEALADTPGSAAATAPAGTSPAAPASAPVVIANEETLAAYNKALRAWINSSSYLPMNAKELATLRDGPRPPQPPPGRVLVFDRTTMSVHLE